MKAITDNKHYFYLVLALLGGGFTFYYAFLGVLAHQGNFDSLEFMMSTWTDNYYARSLSLDFWTGTLAGTFFIVLEGYRLKMKRVWLYILLTFCIAYAFSFPLFLFMRERFLKKQGIQSSGS